MFIELRTANLRPALRLVLAAGAMALSGCCGYLSYNCAPQQPASITANENVESFTSARDQAEGLLAASRDLFTDATVAQLTPQYAAAAASANAWIDYAAGALRNGGTFDAAQSARRLDDVVAKVSTFTEAVEADAGTPSNFRRPFTPLPASAALDPLTAAPPIVAAAEQVRNGVSAGVEAVLAAEGPIAALNQTDRSRIVETLASVKWLSAEDVLSEPPMVPAPHQ